MSTVKEGKVIIELGDKVFYNPKMEMNRDLNVACITAMPDVSSYVDAMAASGIRGIRVKKEVPLDIEVTINDWDPGAFELLKQNAVRNSVDIIATNSGANTLLSSTKYDFVDLDPFGTPSYYIDAVCRSAKRYMGITATDTAPLCGAHLRAGMRKYGAYPLKTEYHSEMGLRILMGKVVREQAKYDHAVHPLLCHATDHYVRLYLKVEHEVEKANRMLDNVGFLVHCFKCLYRYELKGFIVNLPEICPVCGSKVKAAGPLWLGKTKDNDFIDSVITVLMEGKFNKKERSIRVLETIKEEIDVPTFYDQHKICSSLKATPTDIGTLVNELKDSGYRASRAHYDGKGFKTDAHINFIKSTILRLSK
jgi:tRNA (guanine26-N2/guanine27-N2)-dimethyltransferase